jgi:hypothetical protein
MENKEYLEHLQGIKGLIEERTKFKALSGLSGVLAGIIALIGAWVANYVIFHSDTVIYDQVRDNTVNVDVMRLLLVAVATLVCAVSGALFFSFRNARKNGDRFFSKAAVKLFYNFSVPLATGGIFTLVLLMKGYYDMLAPSCLIFYGIALFAAANYTYSDIRALSIAILITGCVSFFIPGRGLYLWAFGFGVLHIIYGSIMYFKYEK